MQIVILGAGQVGRTLAEYLTQESNDVTLVDSNKERLKNLQGKYDIRTIIGHGAHPDILRQAGIEDAELLIAVTDNDETNMLACQVSYALFKTPTKIARIRSNSYVSESKLFSHEHIPIDVLISPEQLMTNFIVRIMEYPGALQVLDFADGKVQLVAVRAKTGGSLVGQAIYKLREHMPTIDIRVAAIYRRGLALLPDGDTIIEEDDEVFFIAARSHIRIAISELRRLENPYRNIIIAGGGHIGQRLAETLENKFAVKLIEFDENAANTVAARLNNTVVLCGDAMDRELLLSENIENTDVFCAVTNDDKTNIMSSVLAKHLGAKKVIALVNNPTFTDLVEGGEIDIAISPQQLTVSGLLRHIRRADIAQIHTLRRRTAEAIEIVAHGDAENSKVIGKRLDKIELPHGATFAAIVRQDKVLMAHGDIVIEPEDHVILFVADRSHAREVEQLFQVGFSFF